MLSSEFSASMVNFFCANQFKMDRVVDSVIPAGGAHIVQQELGHAKKRGGLSLASSLWLLRGVGDLLEPVEYS